MTNIEPAPTRVVVVEPQETWPALIGSAVGSLVASGIVSLIGALIAWWLGPIVLGDAYMLGYWQSFALLYFFRAVIPHGGLFRFQHGPWKTRR